MSTAATMLDQRRRLPPSPPPSSTPDNNAPLPPPLPETVLLRGALCALQGADSDVLVFSQERDAFELTPQAALATPRAAASLVLQLAEVGWLHRRVRRAAGSSLESRKESGSGQQQQQQQQRRVGVG